MWNPTFVKVKLPWNVVELAENLVTIVICLLDDFAGRKSTKDLRCYLAVTTLESIGEGKVRENAGEMLFPVVFIGKIFQGIDLEGDRTQDAEAWGSFQLCQSICFTCTKMPNYRYVQAENPVLLGDKNLKIEKDVVGRG